MRPPQLPCGCVLERAQVLAHLMREIERFHIPDGSGLPCGCGTLMVREVGANSGRLWRKKGNDAGALYSDLMDLPTGNYWPPNSELPLIQAAYKTLNTKQHQELFGWPNEQSHFLLHPLMQLDGHCFGVVCNGESPIPEGEGAHPRKRKPTV